MDIGCVTGDNFYLVSLNLTINIIYQNMLTVGVGQLGKIDGNYTIKI